MNRIAVVRELVQVARELVAEKWEQVPTEFVDRSGLSGAKLKVTGDAIKVVTEKDDNPLVGRSFSLQEEGGWIEGLSKLLGLPHSKRDDFEKWIREKFTRMRTARELVQVARELVAASISFEDYLQWLDELEVGDEVVMRWTAGSFGHYQAKAKLVRVNPKSVVGKLLEDVESQSVAAGGGYPVGHLITLPRSMMDRKFSFDINSPWPIGVDRISKG